MGVEYECQETLYIEKNNPPVFVRWWLVSQSMAESGKRKREREKRYRSSPNHCILRFVKLRPIQ